MSFVHTFSDPPPPPIKFRPKNNMTNEEQSNVQYYQNDIQKSLDLGSYPLLPPFRQKTYFHFFLWKTSLMAYCHISPNGHPFRYYYVTCPWYLIFMLTSFYPQASALSAGHVVTIPHNTISFPSIVYVKTIINKAGKSQVSCGSFLFWYLMIVILGLIYTCCYWLF